jgi:hypothetical protein
MRARSYLHSSELRSNTHGKHISVALSTRAVCPLCDAGRINGLGAEKEVVRNSAGVYASAENGRWSVEMTIACIMCAVNITSSISPFFCKHFFFREGSREDQMASFVPRVETVDSARYPISRKEVMMCAMIVVMSYK